ncbi:bifunctional adenosylcobinamide kinase/adenosylcobinamide-phosphate guanylyltransferase [Metabacillus halosaccharovorans]|uniref:bifunctional adenosylcobinamide kinase/adenosylcobinamide-phosphate guanylyltransferase n=1 Tax=Metabacillus halosaccharovorans TaxID=930124 RepID=UPI0020400967|nr:bifunctional adenosylcobinamide kinase/adenosylcobinamide-phosphate guanylyltransferase [Metabacillus halosaccharovorans]MCM3439484.1 bifunctional adenosylcobinamide kinase/adenosylcobinamide-phosphate guanylyltransferase [Metabacillus halosaccharovorans]
MQLVLGGAFAGKRKIVKEKQQTFSWVSSYEDGIIWDWKSVWLSDTTLVLEGWEKWILQEIKNNESNNQIRHKFKDLFHCFLEEENQRNSDIIIIMLEMGKGIVPLEKEERRLRDIAGRVAQDAAKLSSQVEYVWNGLSKKLK